MLGGYQKADGIVKVKGSEIDLTTSVNGDGQARRAQGIAHVPEDRQREGLIMDFMAWENSVFGYHREKSNQANRFFMDNNAIRRATICWCINSKAPISTPLVGCPTRSKSGSRSISRANTIFC